MDVATALGTAGTPGDHGALAEVIARFHARMVAVASRLLRDDEEARDAVQDAYVAAVTHLDQFDGRACLSTWLHRVVVNAARMRLRARRRRPAEPLDATTLADASADVEASVERRRTQALVHRSLAELGGHHRRVLVLRDLQDGDPEHVARALGVTRGALKIRAYRARKALRDRLAHAGVAAAGVSPPRTRRSAMPCTGSRRRGRPA